jgi:hypothetical protein
MDGFAHTLAFIGKFWPSLLVQQQIGISKGGTFGGICAGLAR